MHASAVLSSILDITQAAGRSPEPRLVLRAAVQLGGAGASHESVSTCLHKTGPGTDKGDLIGLQHRSWRAAWRKAGQKHAFLLGDSGPAHSHTLPPSMHRTQQAPSSHDAVAALEVGVGAANLVVSGVEAAAAIGVSAQRKVRAWWEVRGAAAVTGRCCHAAVPQGC